jgi:hypothetical protein
MHDLLPTYKNHLHSCRRYNTASAVCGAKRMPLHLTPCPCCSAFPATSSGAAATAWCANQPAITTKMPTGQSLTRLMTAYSIPTPALSNTWMTCSLLRWACNRNSRPLNAMNQINLLNIQSTNCTSSQWQASCQLEAGTSHQQHGRLQHCPCQSFFFFSVSVSCIVH